MVAVAFVDDKVVDDVVDSADLLELSPLIKTVPLLAVSIAFLVGVQETSISVAKRMMKTTETKIARKYNNDKNDYVSLYR